ncbi:hypothetical protein [Trinickia sp.]|uniref:hypothetical protein n=1 Tax=Trinickia sp. TaxID=2571163 RepID=UPI003F81A3F8
MGSAMKGGLLRFAAALLMSLAAADACAQTAARPFSALRPAGGAAASAHALVVELSPREVLSGAHLDVVPTVEPPIGSRYAVWVNGALAADVLASGPKQTLALAPNLFDPGVNTIQLALAPPGAPLTSELARPAAARVDDARSRLSLDFAGLRPNPTPTLAQIPQAFDARAWLARTLSVDLGLGPSAPEQLEAATLAVQRIVARMHQVDVSVAYSSEGSIAEWGREPESWGLNEEDLAAGDTLVVGTRATLSRQLPASIARAVTGPFVGIYPANAGKFVIVVISGVTDADCVRAAQWFADSSAALPAEAATVIGKDARVRPPAAHAAIALAEPDPALVRATLRFAAARTKATGEVADFAIRFSGDPSDANYFFGKDSALPPGLRRHLPTYAPLQPGQAVSLPATVGGDSFVAIVGARNAAVVGAVDMLRRPAVWSLFTQHATLFDTRAQSAVPLEAARRSPLAEVRLFLADPLTFWSVLGALLLASFVFVNLALKAQVAQRLEAAGQRPAGEAPPQKST